VSRPNRSRLLCSAGERKVREGKQRSGDADPGAARVRRIVVPGVGRRGAAGRGAAAGDIRGLHIGRLCSAPSPASASGFLGRVVIAMVAGRVHLHGRVPGARRDEGDTQEAPVGVQEEKDECQQQTDAVFRNGQQQPDKTMPTCKHIVYTI